MCVSWQLFFVVSVAAWKLVDIWCVCVCGPLLMAAVVWRRHVEFPVFENNPSLLQSNQPSIRSAQESPPPVSFLFYTLSSILASTLSFFFSSYCGQTWASCWFVSCSSKNLTQIHRYKLAVCCSKPQIFMLDPRVLQKYAAWLLMQICIKSSKFSLLHSTLRISHYLFI